MSYNTNQSILVFSAQTLPQEIYNSHAELFDDFLSDKWTEKEERHKPYYFNQAHVNDILFIKIPDNINADKISIEYDCLRIPSMTNIYILVGKQSTAKILFRKNTNMPGYLAEDIRVIAHEGSHLDFVSVYDLYEQNVTIQKRKAFCKKDATVNWTELTLGAEYTKSSISSLLEEEGAQTKIVVIYLASRNQQFDIYTQATHAAPQTKSDIVTKGVLNDDAKALSRSLIRIEKNAQGSNGYEKQEALLLSEHAQAHANPNLEIHNHDVKCSHGSSVGQLDEEKIFYLMTRGLDKIQAQKKIVEGYFMPLLDSFDEETKEKIHLKIMKALA